MTSTLIETGPNPNPQAQALSLGGLQTFKFITDMIAYSAGPTPAYCPFCYPKMLYPKPGGGDPRHCAIV